MRYKYILIDSHNLLWRSLYYNLQEILLQKEIVYSGGISQFIDRAKQLIDVFGNKDTIVYFCFDNPKSELNIRKLVFPEYKSARLNKKSGKEIGQTFLLLLEILRNHSDNFRIANLDHVEADDLVMPLIKHLNTEEKILTVSADLDWARNIDKNINWYNYKEVYDINSFKEKYGFYPHDNKLIMYKTLKGDNIDSIPNAVPYLNKETLQHIIETYSNPNDLYKMLWKDPELQKDRMKLSDNERQVKINFQLVDFVDINVDIIDIIQKCKRRVKVLRKYYDQLSIPKEPFMLNKQEVKDKFLRRKK